MDSSTPRTIKMGAERAIIYGMIMDVVRRCDTCTGSTNAEVQASAPH